MADDKVTADVEVDAAEHGGIDASTDAKTGNSGNLKSEKPEAGETSRTDDDRPEKPAARPESGSFKDGKFTRCGK